MITSANYKAMFTADRDAVRKTVKSWREAVATLDSIQANDIVMKETPAHTVKCFVAEVGEELARFVIASLVNRSAWDGRIYPSVKEWAASVENSLDEGACRDASIYTNMHMAHLNQVAQAMIQYQPDPSVEVTEQATESGEDSAAPAFTISRNDEFNSTEITFADKPSEEVREALKAMRFRWHSVRRVWYGYKSEEETRAALDALTGGRQEPKAEKKPAQKIDLSGLGANKKTAHGAEFAAVLRADLKRRGVSGVTIRAGKSTYTDSITATIALSAEDFRSAEEAAARDGWRSFFRAEEYGVAVDGVGYHRLNEGRETATQKYISCGSAYDDNSENSNFPILRAFWRDRLARFDRVNHHNMKPENYPELTAAAFERVAAVVAIIQSYNWDHSDSMTDYFDVGFYLDINIKKPKDYTPREYMTDAERAQLKADLAAEAKAEAERLEAWKREQEENRKAEERRAEQEKKDRAEIAAAVTVEDLNETDQFYIFNLAGGIGKESTIAEVKERADSRHDAKISRRLIFSDAAALAKFSAMLLYDFDFLSGKGGTGTNDPRVTDENIMRMNREQRERVQFFAVDSVAVYLGEALQFVINPEGYSYARYTYIPTANTIEATPEESAAKTATDEAAPVEPFYFPAPVEEQAEALTIGEAVTVYQADGWILNILNTASGILTAAERGKYAQYSGVWLTIQSGRKAARVFCSDSKKTVIFSGSPLPLPDSAIFESVTDTGSAVMKQYRSNDDQIREVIALYASFGRAPVLDTVQR